MKGLPVSVFCDRRGVDYSNGGITATFNDLILVGEGVPELAEVREDRPAVRLVRKEFFGQLYIYVVPVDLGPKRHSMFGGCFIYSSDSRFREINAYPIPVHDRVESSY